MIKLTHDAVVARQRLGEELVAVARQTERVPVVVAAEAVAAEDDPTSAMVYLHLQDDDCIGGLPLAHQIKLPRPLDEHELAELARGFIPRISSEVICEAITTRIVGLH